MTQRIVILPGDGIGPEVAAAGERILGLLAPDLAVAHHLIGGAALEAEGAPLPDSTLAACIEADAVILGAVGGPQWSDLPRNRRPETGLLQLRQALGVYANLRPVRAHPAIAGRSPLKTEVLAGVDILFVRELTGGAYFGDKGRKDDVAWDVCRYSRGEIARVLRLAGRRARERSGRLTLVDKANVMETGRLWREVAQEIVASEFADLDFDCLYVDAAAMHLLTRPRDFDVIVTENMFGDILTDEACVLAGAIGVLGSAALGDGPAGLYEPIHGSAPDIAGKDIANPLGFLDSLTMMLDYSLGRAREAARLRDGMDHVMRAGILTPDLGGTSTNDEVAAAIADRLATTGSEDHEREAANV